MNNNFDDDQDPVPPPRDRKTYQRHRSDSTDFSECGHGEKHKRDNKVKHYDIPGEGNNSAGRRRRKKKKDSQTEMYRNPVYEGSDTKPEEYVSPSGVEMNSIQGSETHRSLITTAREQGRMKSVRIDDNPDNEKQHKAINEDTHHKVYPYLRRGDSTTSASSVNSPSVPGYSTHQHREDIRNFVSSNIKHRECKKYIRDSKRDNGNCCCGRDSMWHEEKRVDKQQKSKEKWSWDTCTREINADTFGTINFTGFGNDNNQHAPYVRVNHETHVENLDNVWTLMHKYWHVPPPRLIISVTGGAKRFYLKHRLQESFKRGLVNAATTTGAWIVTGGTNTGVMEFVGEAIREHSMTQVTEQPIVALGIATWGIVDNKDALVGTKNFGQFPTYYDVDDLNLEKRGIAALDANHSHFILVDDGSEGKFGKEINFRTAFEQYLSQKMETGVSKNQSVNVPVVLLVLEGGENTLKTAMSAIKQGTPVVVIQGSGRAADYIAKAMKETKASTNDDEKTEYPKDFQENYKQHAKVMFDWGRETDPKEKETKVTMCVQNLMDLLSHRPMITVFALDNSETTNEIDQAILDALLRAKRSDLNTQLKLALAWNRCDVAREKILTVENRQKWQKSREFLYEAMFTALVQDKVDFVQLFMDNGVELKKFLSIRKLNELYDDVVLEGKFPSGCAELLNNLLNQVSMHSFTGICCYRKPLIADQVPELLKLIGAVMAYLLGDQQDRMYDDNKYIVTGESDEETLATKTQFKRRASKFSQYDFTNPARELFLWSILLNRRELAMLFWKSGKDHIGGALIASALLKSLAAEANKEVEMDLSTDLLDHAATFEGHAVGVLSECYSKEKDLSHQLLVRELKQWGGTTLFALSDAAEQMEFMGHSACQTKLNKIWNGKMALYTPTWKIIASMFMPFFLLSVKFHGDPVGRSDDKILKGRSDYEKANNELTGSQNQIVPNQGDEDFVQSKKGVKGDHVTDTQFYAPNRRKKKGYSNHRLQKVICCGECSDKDSTFGLFEAMLYYYKSPVAKFYFHTLSYVLYLALFSYFVLIELAPRGSEHWLSSGIEFVVWGWTATIILEEIRQVLTKDPKSLQYKVSGYFSSIWNIFDQIVHFMFLICIVLRLTLTGGDFVWARMFYAVTLIMYYLRFLQAFFVWKNLGPKVIMIRRMLTDLMFFILILSVFLMAYGVASQALRFPNAKPTWNVLKDVIYEPYWNIYGELFLQEINGDIGPCTNDTTLEPDLPYCPEKNALAVLLFAIYMIMTNVLLLNLLIAMFSYTFEKVQENSEKVWRYYRYSLIYEYFDRPTLAPPLIVFNHITRFAKFINRKCRKNEKISHDFRVVLELEADTKLTAFERVGMENYLYNKRIIEKEHIEAKVSSAGERIEKVIENLETIKEQVSTQESGGSVSKQTELPKIEYTDKEGMTIMDRRINKLESYLENQQHQLNSALEMLQVMVKKQPPPPQPSLQPFQPHPLSVSPSPIYGSSMHPQMYGQPQTGQPVVRTGTYHMHAPIQPPNTQGRAGDSPYGSVGGVPVAPTRRDTFKPFASPQIEIDDQDPSDSQK